MSSKIADIDTDYSLTKIANVQKVEQAIKVEKLRVQQAAINKQKNKDILLDIAKRSRIFEIQKAKNLAEQIRLGKDKLSLKYGMMHMDDMTNYAQYRGDDDLNIVAEKTLHTKYGQSFIPAPGSSGANQEESTQKSVNKSPHFAKITHHILDCLPNSKKDKDSDEEVNNPEQLLQIARSSIQGRKMTNSYLNQGHKLTGSSSRVQLFGPDQILVYEREKLLQSLIETRDVDDNGFSKLGNALNQVPIQLRHLDQLPNITQMKGSANQKESWRKSSEKLPKQSVQFNSFSIPVREEIQMVYNTNDGSSLIFKDLGTSPKTYAEYQIAPKPKLRNQENKAKILKPGKADYFRDKEHAKTLSIQAFRKSQQDFSNGLNSKVSPQSKMRYPKNNQGNEGQQQLAIGAHTMLRNNIVITGDQLNGNGIMVSPRLNQIKKTSMSPSIFEKTHTQIFLDSQDIKNEALQKEKEIQQMIQTSPNNSQLTSAIYQQSKSLDRRPELVYGGRFQTKVPHKTNSTLQKNDPKQLMKATLNSNAKFKKGAAQQSLFKHHNRTESNNQSPRQQITNFNSLSDPIAAQQLLTHVGRQMGVSDFNSQDSVKVRSNPNEQQSPNTAMRPFFSDKQNSQQIKNGGGTKMFLSQHQQQAIDQLDVQKQKSQQFPPVNDNKKSNHSTSYIGAQMPNSQSNYIANSSQATTKMGHSPRQDSHSNHILYDKQTFAVTPRQSSYGLKKKNMAQGRHGIPREIITHDFGGGVHQSQTNVGNVKNGLLKTHNANYTVSQALLQKSNPSTNKSSQQIIGAHHKP